MNSENCVSYENCGIDETGVIDVMKNNDMNPVLEHREYNSIKALYI